MTENKNTLKSLEKRLSQIPGMSALIEEEHAVLVTEESAASQIADLIRQTREDAGLSQAALGKKVGVSQARISQIEQGAKIYGTSVVLLARLAAACGRTLQMSFGR